MSFRYSAAKLNEGILLFGDAGGSVFCLKFSSVTGCLFDLIGQQIPSGGLRQRLQKLLKIFKGYIQNTQTYFINPDLCGTKLRQLSAQ